MNAFSSRCIYDDFVWNVEDSVDRAVDLMDAPRSSDMHIVPGFFSINIAFDRYKADPQ